MMQTAMERGARRKEANQARPSAEPSSLFAVGTQNSPVGTQRGRKPHIELRRKNTGWGRWGRRGRKTLFLILSGVKGAR